MAISDNKEQAQVAVTVNLSAALHQHLQDLATIKRSDINKLASSYIEERIEQDLPMLRRKQYFAHLKEVLHEHNVPHATIETLEDNFLY